MTEEEIQSAVEELAAEASSVPGEKLVPLLVNFFVNQQRLTDALVSIASCVETNPENGKGRLRS